MPATVEQLFRGLPERVNADPVMRREGRFLTTEMLIGVGDREFHLVIERGRLDAVLVGPFDMRAYAFAIRAPGSVWRQFWAPHPRPGFQDIFALARYGHARIDGDVGPMLSALRYVKGLLALPRGQAVAGLDDE